MTLLINSTISVNGSVNYGQLTQTQINALSPSNGDIVWNLTTGEALVRANGAWIAYSTGQIGPQGPQGPQGDPGTAATIAVGSVTTSAPGSNAVVTNTGTTSSAVFDFTLPRGIQGPTGATGEMGLPGEKGDPGDAATITVGTTATLSAGSPATVANVGSLQNAILQFGIPEGLQGNQGAPGAAGTAATITVGSTTTGSPGSNASVTNVGTSSEAVFNFTIPRGDTGATGVVAATAPVLYDSPTQTVSIRTATGSQSGAISAADWTTFNNKLSSASVIGTSPLAWDSATNTMSIQKASTTLTGALSAADFTTFNNKLDATQVLATSPLSWNSGTKTMSISYASPSTNGAIGSGDYVTWNNKANGSKSIVPGTGSLVGTETSSNVLYVFDSALDSTCYISGQQGSMLFLKNINIGFVTIDASGGGGTIDGQSTIVLGQWQSVTLVQGGYPSPAWYII